MFAIILLRTNFIISGSIFCVENFYFLVVVFLFYNFSSSYLPPTKKQKQKTSSSVLFTLLLCCSFLFILFSHLFLLSSLPKLTITGQYRSIFTLSLFFSLSLFFRFRWISKTKNKEQIITINFNVYSTILNSLFFPGFFFLYYYKQ